ncbi:MAG TPA: hypothetical protein VNQ90_05485 [Chthoniobacteraceae bacterium]|nr:hypothetical protein [Chthoniobacteraceae bacterium]
MSPGLRFIVKIAALLGLGVSLPAATLTLMPPTEWPPSNQWYLFEYGSPTVGTANVDGRSWLTVERTSGLSGAQLVYTAGSYSDNGLPKVDPANQLADFTGRVVLAADTWAAADGVGVVLRSRRSSFGGDDAYYLAMSSEGLGLYWGIGNNSLAPANRLAFDAFETAPGSLDDGNSYLLSFSAVSNRIDASLYASWTLDESGAILGTPIATLSYTDLRDVARTDGYFALRGGRFTSNRTAYFRDLTVTTIPEPSVAGLGLLCAGLGAIVLCLRSRKGA